MKGSMRERRPGVWELIVQLPRDATSARARQLSRTVHGTQREAQRSFAALVAEVSAGKVTSSTTTLRTRRTSPPSFPNVMSESSLAPIAGS